ncbi:Bystin-domain-containing protein [Rhizopus microsporus var. microsporus]|uniref:Bystin-domain-containing protein n=2 Tax=Rhizopus microsporus TaxID=58291 RepID=A0A2G4TAE6_RHIZD|nr:Bystin-domain-containing protein [Rhizopus microsporus ATCC 52813]ORE10651.1 Bystin-domain-containing protein [Rhizopus microsporus var. microsporus]PHZ17994.1 Bystin-domain-containing protein [Rhizopus microsporus ATCC 52813]
MGKYNLEKAHTLTNGYATPYTTWDNSDLKTKRQKGDFFSLFNEIDGIEADADQHIKDAISQIERDQAKRLEELRQQQDLDSEESLVDKAKQLSTKSVIISFDTLKLEFDEDSRGNALFKIALMDEDIKLHQTPTWPVPKPVPIMSLERILVLRKYEKMQHGIEDIPLSTSNPKVAEIYKRLGMFLSRYKIGKLPRSFKIMPMLKNWEEVIYLTQPDHWTPQAMYEASKLFMSHNTVQMQNFISYVLFPYTRQRITNNSNYHLEYPVFLALQTALLNARIFTLGYLKPLCESGECTAMEASVIGCIMALHTKLKPVPILWSLMSLPFSIPTTLFILVALERKRKRIPRAFYRPLTYYFIRAAESANQLPYIWYQALYVFAKYCADELDKSELYRLMKLVRARKGHYVDMITNIQNVLMPLLPLHKPDDFDSPADGEEEDGLKNFEEEILSDSDIESSDESDSSYLETNSDSDGDDDSDDDDDYVPNPVRHQHDDMVVD